MLFNIKPIILRESNYAFATLVNNTVRILLSTTKKMRMNNYYKS